MRNDEITGYAVDYAGKCRAIFEDYAEAWSFAVACEEAHGAPVHIRFWTATITDEEDVTTLTGNGETA